MSTPTPTTADATDCHTAKSDAFTRNNKAFAGIMFALQAFLIVMYAIFIRPTPALSVIKTSTGSYDGLDNGLVAAVSAALLVLIGFGLYFSYLKNMQWSGLGFTFLITVIVFQYYFVINAFWTKSNVQQSHTTFSDTYMPATLSDQNNDTANSYGNTAVGAFKCALSMCIAFAAIGGRGGPLEALIIVVVGTVTYELNRQILSLFSVNQGGSMTIFEFGGFFGTTLAILLRKTSQSEGLENHKEFMSNKFNLTLALVGAAFCWVFFPAINMDIPTGLFIYSNAGLSTIYCISATVVTTVGFSLLLDGRLSFRDIITAPIAGGVIIGSSSTYIYSPLESLMFGVAAGILQVLFNRAEKKLGSHPFWSNGVFFLFGVQGLIGGLFSAVIRAINQTSTTYQTAYNNLNTNYVYDQRGQISAAFITMGISVATGLVVFIFLKIVNSETKDDYYHDKTYWIMSDDGISKRVEKVEEPEPDLDVDYSEGQSFKGEHSYL